MSDPQNVSDYFMMHHAHAPADQRGGAVRAAVACGHGSLITPETADAHSRPASHLYELDLFSVTATGCTFDACVENWFRVAARVLDCDAGAIA
ncbi:hypothetical protein AN189_17975 [Loktanella sp. 3ANDIMAR09]|uniref:hypothetical protein n=1 Tax=Loktanella sp. 3ANDIMAR09 TaxID=1225657 RepID=UPI0006FE3F83|nr:hypothetical protein [Loktanella sp. 3ANDIMAR09]KQI66946.1 hypothetical protein AN189_17975 [Loktanella sp. 3ANDIMAR09]